jgi:hypothetical protein
MRLKAPRADSPGNILRNGAMLLGLLATAGCGGTDFHDYLVGSDPAVAPAPGGTDGSPVPVGDPATYVTGEAFRVDTRAESQTVLMACKSETQTGVSSFRERRLRFEPATGAFFLDGGRVFDTGFVWDAGTNEFVASRTVPIGTGTGEYRAKVTSQGRPSYYRYKLTLQDFSFQQTECYEGIAD